MLLALPSIELLNLIKVSFLALRSDRMMLLTDSYLHPCDGSSG